MNGKEVKCDCKEQIRLQLHYLGAGIGSRYHNLGFGDFIGGFEEVYDMVKNYVAKFDDHYYYGEGITFCGPLGTGKTFAASLILKELVKKGRICLMLPFQQILDFQRLNWDDSSNKKFEEAQRVEVLAIDEVFDSDLPKKKSFLADTLEQIIRYRVDYRLPTIITTNISRSDEMSSYPRVFSLLSSSQIRHEIKGDDQRLDFVRKRNRKLATDGERRPIV